MTLPTITTPFLVKKCSQKGIHLLARKLINAGE
jgi:hypothetical protein